ncbi:pyridoxal 5'-phosphate synthase [Aequorivita sp. SDUM287046]|uniref:Pyridoxal 5'-phosphate synthase n=1 Tax=Aequorivita aurantiaca TaxID=3053356 RepID=A0ABT8DQK6_9FLAO|nr:pyridoxal 5'-phosphate synthase [Aequorivita aurantiaca]MDN3725347.1 pyridoxal 5'-phosphate synthase [Aequorivita aurantiaca]
MEPIEIFKKWFEEELKLSKVRIPDAVCLSTIGLDNFPNARFVSLKEVIENLFFVTGPLNFRKGIEIEKNENVALTFWRAETERQVRIQGKASKISEQLADKYFNERNIHSQAVSSICEQGKETNDLELLKKKVMEKVFTNTKIERPENWGGYSIEPKRIEFKEFKNTRFHDRKLYEILNGKWNCKHIQP